MFANGVDVAHITLSFTGHVDRGKELTVSTSLGVLDPTAPSGQQRTIKVRTGEGPTPLVVTLRAEQAPGVAHVTVTSVSGLNANSDMIFAPVQEDLTLKADADSIPADSTSFTDVTFEFSSNDPQPRDVLIKTSLGRVSPEKTGTDARLRSIHVVPKQDPTALPDVSPRYVAKQTFKLYADDTPGNAAITAEVGGTQQNTTVVLTAVDDLLSVDPSQSQLPADGQGSTDVTLSFSSNSPQARQVTVTTSLGTLSPDKKDEAARARTVTILPGRNSDPRPQALPYFGTATIKLFVGTTPGTAALSATMGAQTNTETVTFTAPEDRTVTLTTEDDVTNAPANGRTVNFTVKYSGTSAKQALITLTTTLGTLDLSQATLEAQRHKTITVANDSPVTVQLQVGNVPGEAVVTASGESIPSVTRNLTLDPALPTLLALGVVDTSVLDATHTQTDISVGLQRKPGEGSISQGISIGFLACCKHGSASDEPCTDLVSVPAFKLDDNGDGHETTSLALTPTGRALVNENGTTSHDDTAVTLYSFIIVKGNPTCSQLAVGVAPALVSAQDQLSLALRKVAP